MSGHGNNQCKGPGPQTCWRPCGLKNQPRPSVAAAEWVRGEQQEVKPEVKQVVSTLTLSESGGGLGVVLRM